ncbi:MAG: hypothetical protein IPN15_16255 [Saprospiraceae bacterium]|nr:hypothetical protein [Candidatus Vicinibacter affinis]
MELTPTPLVFNNQIIISSDTCPTGKEMNVWLMEINMELIGLMGHPILLAVLMRIFMKDIRAIVNLMVAKQFILKGITRLWTR